MSEMEPTSALNSGDICRGRYLVFRLGQEEFGMRIVKVREIKSLGEITLLPRMPAGVRGIVNSCGILVPVVDLRAGLGLPEENYTEQSYIIVAEIRGLD